MAETVEYVEGSAITNWFFLETMIFRLHLILKSLYYTFSNCSTLSSFVRFGNKQPWGEGQNLWNTWKMVRSHKFFFNNCAIPALLNIDYLRLSGRPVKHNKLLVEEVSLRFNANAWGLCKIGWIEPIRFVISFICLFYWKRRQLTLLYTLREKILRVTQQFHHW